MSDHENKLSESQREKLREMLKIIRSQIKDTDPPTCEEAAILPDLQPGYWEVLMRRSVK